MDMDKFEAENEKWENGELGRDPDYIGVVKDNGEIDNALGIKGVYLRLDKETYEFFENMAKQDGVIVKAKIREALESFVK